MPQRPPISSSRQISPLQSWISLLKPQMSILKSARWRSSDLFSILSLFFFSWFTNILPFSFSTSSILIFLSWVYRPHTQVWSINPPPGSSAVGITDWIFIYLLEHNFLRKNAIIDHDKNCSMNEFFDIHPGSLPMIRIPILNDVGASDYDVPKGCEETSCPCTVAGVAFSSPKLPPKKKNSSVPILPPKKHTWISFFDVGMSYLTSAEVTATKSPDSTLS